MSKIGVDSIKIREVNLEGNFNKEDLLVSEEPLEIRIGFGSEPERQQMSLSVTMRTPGNDLELALGFLFSEGLINQKEDVYSIKHCEDLGKQEERDNVVRAELSEKLIPEFDKLKRNFYISSSCGI